MANSKYEYVRDFEKDDSLLPNCAIVIRIDGHSFHRFSAVHDFAKPNDRAALDLMNHAARCVMSAFPDITLGYGISDEFSFLLRPSCVTFGRRDSKLVSTVVSIFTGAYIFAWPTYFPDKAMQYPPSFDGRAVLYPTRQTVVDYFSWRQVDAHINNLFNTCFWTLQRVDPKHGGPRKSAQEAEEVLRGTVAAQKNELLWRDYGVNYNDEAEMYKKGSILLYNLGERAGDGASKTSRLREEKRRRKEGVSVVHVDLIQESFWLRYPHILEP
ncbi:putative TRNAHis guanylyltransferase [Taphrina deformans PYCC 5710]|uniref:tRNA(His) guanylyltransferase n=1 Tax=Taphrina deformans (strain PYCC 5710 / ATCC 11124 / CBS 356.35 / IMI 108563 / JCM 9778 / NBRC 8474) TaxID=1097556 RepID=R4XAR6_TAPDE|nr:putative TRNAHis guanylyltransferase [Taphrina deformans PYCC 5710]|eukprot:CCG82949.1 putative TRNAHis guanylyltransferase [Taphrina deformans PYCC 5710]